jgi:type II secretory pathway pseudopilin PulG
MYSMRSLHSRRGFTIIEAVVSMSILLMIGLGIIAFERSVLTNTKVLQSGLTMQQQVRRTLAVFVADLRAATQSSAGAYPIEVAATSTITFYANIDSDAAIEKIRYFVATGTLRRGTIKPTGTVYNSANERISTIVKDLANPTSTPIFTFYDTGYDGFTSSSSDPLPTPINIPSIRMVKMSIVVNPNGVRAPVMQTYTTQVSVRNLKDNL